MTDGNLPLSREACRMRYLRLLFCLLLMSTPCLADSRFDLFPGRWQGPVKGLGIVTLEVAGPESKGMSFSLEMMSADVRMATASGAYRVTSNKGQSHFNFHVDGVKCSGRLEKDQLGGFNFAGWQLRPGADARGIIRYEEGKLVLDAFDPDTGANVAHFVLQQVQ